MKKQDFVIGMLCGAVLFGGGGAVAAGITAVLSDNPFYINGEQVSLTAYNIADNNYVRLRDIGKALDIGVTYDPETNSVSVNSNERYTEEAQQPQTQPQEKVIDGNDAAREDFSQAANPAVFDETYTRGAYNAIRQTMVDRDTILAGNNEEGYNPNYSYAHFVDHEFTMNSPGKTETAMKSVAAYINSYYQYEFGYEPGIENYYEYPGYRICKVRIHTFFDPANRATDGFLTEIQNLSDREKVKRIINDVCDRIDYDAAEVSGINEIFTSAATVKGACGTYSNAFLYLCQRAGIPCVAIRDYDHAWNEIYADGKWEIVDACNYDTARSDTWLFSTNYPKQDENPSRTMFAKELLVPGSTK